MISVAGQKVYPAEVERVLLDHAAVSQAAVVGLPDEVFGEKVVAFLVAGTNPGADLKNDVQQFAKEDLANYKVPREFDLIDELPRNASGKILKTKLREMQAAEPVNSTMTEPTADTPTANLRPASLRQQLQNSFPADQPKVATTFVQNIVQALTDSKELPDPKERFLDTGFDSLMVVEMSSQIQVELGSETEVPATLVFDYPRICDLAQFLLTAIVAEQPQPAKQPATPQAKSNTGNEVAAMSEEQALAELMKELEA